MVVDFSKPTKYKFRIFKNKEKELSLNVAGTKINKDKQKEQLSVS
jgi:hypothetical protein